MYTARPLAFLPPDAASTSTSFTQSFLHQPDNRYDYLMRILEQNPKSFDSDIERFGSYEYSGGGKLSALLANKRISQAIYSMVDVLGASVLDVGCGDGVYTAELASLGPSRVLGVDAASQAVNAARKRMEGDARFSFEVRSVYDLDSLGTRFDVGIIRGVLHHLKEPDRALKAIAGITKTFVVLEPNGYNPVLKLIEKASPYHRNHEERSFFPSTLRRWTRNAGARIECDDYIGLVPMFCPAFVARGCKVLEPDVEAMPLVRHICCGQYIFKASNEM